MEWIFVQSFLKLYHQAWPSTCLVCHKLTKRHLDLCLDCQKQLPTARQSCFSCGLPGQRCYRCNRCAQQPWSVDSVTSLFQYEGPVVQLVYQMKFNKSLAVTRLFGQLLADKFVHQSRLHCPDVIIPVPLSSTRLLQRGFNQAKEIANYLEQQSGILMDTDSCRRVKHTAFQARLVRSQRQLNVEKAFEIKLSSSYDYVVLVDDVVTSGLTINAMSEQLKQQGVKQIDVWCVARTPWSKS